MRHSKEELNCKWTFFSNIFWSRTSDKIEISFLFINFHVATASTKIAAFENCEIWLQTESSFHKFLTISCTTHASVHICASVSVSVCISIDNGFYFAPRFDSLLFRIDKKSFFCNDLKLRVKTWRHAILFNCLNLSHPTIACSLVLPQAARSGLLLVEHPVRREGKGCLRFWSSSSEIPLQLPRRSVRIFRDFFWHLQRHAASQHHSARFACWKKKRNITEITEYMFTVFLARNLTSCQAIVQCAKPRNAIKFVKKWSIFGMIGFSRSTCHVKTENESVTWCRHLLLQSIAYFHIEKSTLLKGVNFLSVDFPWYVIPYSKALNKSYWITAWLVALRVKQQT